MKERKSPPKIVPFTKKKEGDLAEAVSSNLDQVTANGKAIMYNSNPALYFIPIYTCRTERLYYLTYYHRLYYLCLLYTSDAADE